MDSTVVKLGKREEEGNIYVMDNFSEVICSNSEIYHNFTCIPKFDRTYWKCKCNYIKFIISSFVIVGASSRHQTTEGKL